MTVSRSVWRVVIAETCGRDVPGAEMSEKEARDWFDYYRPQWPNPSWREVRLERRGDDGWERVDA